MSKTNTVAAGALAIVAAWLAAIAFVSQDFLYSPWTKAALALEIVCWAALMPFRSRTTFMLLSAFCVALLLAEASLDNLGIDGLALHLGTSLILATAGLVRTLFAPRRGSLVLLAATHAAVVATFAVMNLSGELWAVWIGLLAALLVAALLVAKVNVSGGQVPWRFAQ